MSEIKKEIAVIQNDSVVNMKVSGYFYSRMVQAAQNMLKKQDSEQVRKGLESINAGAITEEWVYDLESLLIFCKDFEKLAKEDNLIENKSLEEVISEN